MVYKKGQFGIWPVVIIFPALILYTVFSLFPAVCNIILSFTDFNGNIHSKINWLGFKNYKLAFLSSSGSEVLDAIKITLIFSIAVTLIQNFIAAFLAILCDMKLKLRNFYRSVIFLPSILGATVIGLSWTLIFDPFSGPVNKVLNIFGIDSALLGDPNAALFLVIFVMIWANFGYAMVLYLSGLQGIPQELYESGKIDGTNFLTSIWYITLPMLRPIVTVNILISLIGSLRSYDYIMVLTLGGPGNSTSTLAMYIFNKLFNSAETQGYVAALSIILFLIVLAVVAITQYYLRRREVDM